MAKWPPFFPLHYLFSCNVVFSIESREKKNPYSVSLTGRSHWSVILHVHLVEISWTSELGVCVSVWINFNNQIFLKSYQNYVGIGTTWNWNSIQDRCFGSTTGDYHSTEYIKICVCMSSIFNIFDNEERKRQKQNQHTHTENNKMYLTLEPKMRRFYL